MSDIPEEIIAEILTRLPIKSLLRFRCVCKRWNYLIDSQDFIKLHLNHPRKFNPDPKLLISGYKLYSADFDTISGTNIPKIEQLDPPYSETIFGTDIDEFKIVGCCNGVVCLWLTNYENQKIVMLWNPSTRKFRQLPDFGEWGFVFHLGFGYDAINDDYKVVKVIQFENSAHLTLNVYSLGSNMVVKVEAFPYRCTTSGIRAVFVAGGLHWKLHSDLSHQGVERKWIVAFYLETEMTQLVPQPDCSLNKNFEINLAVLGGQLSLVYNYSDEYAADIWIMKDYGKKESWTKIASITNSASMSLYCMCPISFSKTGKQILLTKDEGDLVCYDLEEKSAKNVELWGLGLYLSYDVYSESIVQLNSGSPTTTDERDQGSTNQKKMGKRDNFPTTGSELVL